MSGPDRAWSDAERLHNMISSLRSQTGPDDGSRDELLASLERIVHGEAGPEDRTVDGIVDLLSDSSLGDSTLDEPDPEADPGEVAGVLDRMDREEGRRPVAVIDHGPVQAWAREFRRLVDSHTPAEVGEVLEAYGFGRERRAELCEPSELTRDGGEVLARAVVTGLGENWTDSGFAGLYSAARRHRRPGSMRTLRICGLGGAEAVDPEAVRVRLEAPIDTLPAVRGRDRTVGELVAAVRRRAGRAQVLLGSAGYGKTTVALAVARRVRSSRMLGLCLPAADLDELVDGLALAAMRTGATVVQLDAALHGTGEQRAVALWELLDRSSVPWTIVLDAAGEEAVGHPAWTHRSRIGAVLVTTRFGDAGRWGPGTKVVRIGRVRPEAGGQIVLDWIGPRPDLGVHASLEQAEVLARRLDGVPLALSSAGRLVAAARPGVGTLQEVAHEIAALRADDPLSAVYELGVRSGPSGHLREMIRLLACFAPNRPLPVAVLDADGERPAGPLLPQLVRTGLVEERMGLGIEHTITIHPALAERSRRDSAVDAGEVDRQAIALLRRRLDELDPGVLANRPSVRMLEPHVAELVASPALEGELLVEALELAQRTASALMRCGHQGISNSLLSDALALAGRLGDDHPATLALRHTRARAAALDGGDFVTAERELVDVLAQRTGTLGPRHPATLATRDALAWVSAERGMPEDARDEIAAVLAARTDVLGPEDPRTLATRHRLCWVDVQLGHAHEALPELDEVLRLRRRVLGRDHLDVYSTRYRLAWTLVKANRLGEAEDAYRDLQDDLEAAAGWAHPLTLMVRVRVGWTLIKQNRPADAEEHLRDVLADQVAVLGTDHRRVVRTRHLLAYVALQRGAVAEALRGFEEVVAQRTALLGDDHPDTLDSRSQLAWTQLHAGSARASDRAFQAVVADRQRVYRPLNPDTLKARGLVARARTMRGRLGEAQVLLRRLLDDVAEAVPADHRLMLDTRHTLAVVQGLRGRSTTAEQELRALLADRTRILGPGHRETLAGGDYLAWILGRQGRIGEAFEQAQPVLDARTALLGPRHVHTLTSRYRIAWLTLLDGDRPAAGEQFDRLLEELTTVLGPDHPDTLRCRHSRARVRLLSGDHAGAAELALELLHDQTRVQGPDAVDTFRAAEELGMALVGLPDRRTAGEALLIELLQRRGTVLDHDHPDNVSLRARIRRSRP